MSSPRSILSLIAVAAAILGAGSPEPAYSQEAPEAIPTPQLTQATQAGWFQASIVTGRIEVTGRRFGSTTTQSKANGANEQLTIRIAGNTPSISYKTSGAEGEFTLDISSADHVEIRQVPGSKSKLEAVEFRQVANEPITLTIGSGNAKKTYSAKTLWHLLIERPDVCRKNLLPLLEPIVGGTDLASLAGQIEAAMLHTAADDSHAERERWARLVDQLGDDSYSRRESADRQLRNAGPLLVTFLGQLDKSKLDAEQQFRIHRIVRALSDQAGDDTPALVASWLVGDPEIWLALASRPEESTRRLAAEHLETLIGRPIDFDPAADEKTRQVQIEQLRQQIGSR